jgi:ppGpp synthetase/RelA/SpoT-type nucleotidyltranferase
MNITLPDHIEKQFKKIYDKNHGAYKKCETVLVQDLENVLRGSDVGHVPVHARVKSWERARNTAGRRYKERVAMAEIWGALDDADQDEYCTYWEFDRELAQTLNTGDEVQNAMHDLLGARVALYFPDDVRAVENLLRKAGYTIGKILPKGGMYDLSRLRKFFYERKTKLSNGAIVTQDETFQKSFSGYGALHFIVGLPSRLARRIALPESAWRELKIEIQVGTVVMHAWSEVEHDIIYKPSDGMPLSEDVKRIMDLINGIALTGEVALRQLEATTRQIQGRSAGEMQYAQGPAQLGAWLEQYFAVNDLPIEPLSASSQWDGLKELFEVLKARRSHHRDSVNELLGSMKDILTGLSFSNSVPLHILLKYLESQPERTYSDGEKARFDAIQTVNVYQLAYYIDSTKRSGSTSHRINSKFSYVDLLDILHTEHSRYRAPRETLESSFSVNPDSGQILPDIGNVALAARATILLAKRGFSVRLSRPGRDGGHQNILIRSISESSASTLDDRGMLTRIPDQLCRLFPPNEDFYIPKSLDTPFYPTVFEPRIGHGGSGGRWQCSGGEFNWTIEYMSNEELKSLPPVDMHDCDYDDEYERKIYDWMRQGKIVPNALWAEKYHRRDNDLESEYERLIAAVRFRSQLHPHLELADEKAVWMGHPPQTCGLWYFLCFNALSTSEGKTYLIDKLASRNSELNEAGMKSDGSGKMKRLA